MSGMEAAQISVRIDPVLKRAVERYCRSNEIVMNHFIQEALIDRLEELEDIDHLKRIRHQPARPLTEAFAELGLNGDL